MSFNFKSKEFYINLDKKDIPPKNHSDYLALRDWERKKCIEGITINGIHIWGSLYYHLNHFKTDIDYLDNQGNIVPKIEVPTFRDNEWLMHEAYNNSYTATLKEGLIVGSGRQVSKTTTQVSLVTRQLFLFQNSEVLGLFLNKPDKETFTKKLLVALQNITDFLVIPNIDKDLTKEYIRFGITQKDNEPFIYSKLYMYLTSGGINTEIGAGKTVNMFFVDEALKNGSKVFVKDSYKNIEDLNIGDKIYGNNGKLTNVLNKISHVNVNLYKFILSDNREITASENHLWTVKDCTTNKTITVNSKFLFERNNSIQIDNRYSKIVKKQRWFIPKQECLEFEKKDLKIEPYYLGCWLGDGDKSNPCSVANIDKEVIKYCNDYAQQLGGTLNSHNKGYKHTIISPKYKENKNYLRFWFDEYNLKNNKHIPSDYLYSSKEDRLELLKGLCDTDGSVYSTGHIEFSNTNKLLIDQIEFLIRSLGINCKVSLPKKAGYKNTNGDFIQCKDSYKITISTNVLLFKIQRKLDNYNKTKNLKKKSIEEWTSIKSIEYIGKGDATCIEIDNENKLFLAENFISTHNCAKGNVIEAHEAVLPAINSKFGMRCSPFYTATGGNLEKSKDFESMFFNPETYKFKSFENENKKTGFFLGGWYRSDFKKESNFIDWYNKKNNLNIIPDSELESIKYYETDFDLANKTLDFEEEKAKETSLLAWQKRKMYYPRNLGDMFLKVEQNPFSKFIAEFEKLLKFLETQNVKSLDFDSQGKFFESSKRPLIDFPYNKNDAYILDTPLCVSDEPRLISGTKLYVGGLDPYNTIKTAESASLGSFYIMRRETSDYSDSYNNRIVAWYNGRKDITSFRKLLTNTLLYYGVEQGCVTMLHEAADDNLTQHYTEKNKGYYLEDTYTLSREINPNSTSFNSKGLRPTPRTQAYYLQLILDYCEEELEDGRLGLWRIPDPYLIKQLMNFDGDLSDKDSLVSFGHTLIHLKKESKYRPNVSERVEVKEKPKVTNNAFGMGFSNYKKSAI
jgi:hypothetical protein